MADNGDSKFFPLSFYDGECQLDIGHVRIHSSLDYKSFQSILSQKIGISPNQMSIYLVDRKKSHQDQRRILITGRASFRLILQEKNCAVLVVLKRSRRDRRRRSKLSNAESGYYWKGNSFSLEPENFILLRRNVPDLINSLSVLPYHSKIAPPEFGNFNNQFQNLQIHGDGYASMLPDPSLYKFPVVEDPYLISNTPVYPFCEECMNANSQDKAVPFHLCVNDAIIISFRSSAGPIGRQTGDSL